jgi:hypothetical protein
MKNCLILGSGRSGTSMIGGILHNAGYYMGQNLYLPNEANPKGFFENKEINDINELILSSYDKRGFFNVRILNTLRWHFEKKFPRRSKDLFKGTVHRPCYLQRWLISIPVGIDVRNISRQIAERIAKAIDHKPFCYKDPRFSYTLPVWNKFLDDNTVYLCVYREPNITVKSILKECQIAFYLRNMSITEKSAYNVWFNMYSHILEKHYTKNDFIFCHYKQIYDGTIIEKISEKLNTKLTHSFVAKKLNRTRSNSAMPKHVVSLYMKLCELSDYNVKSSY